MNSQMVIRSVCSMVSETGITKKKWLVEEPRSGQGSMDLRVSILRKILRGYWIFTVDTSLIKLGSWWKIFFVCFLWRVWGSQAGIHSLSGTFEGIKSLWCRWKQFWSVFKNEWDSLCEIIRNRTENSFMDLWLGDWG